MIITKEYERKIDFITERVATIEQLLRQQQTATDSPKLDRVRPIGLDAKNESPTHTTTALPSPESQQSAVTDQDISDATTGSHSTAAQRLVEKAVEDSPAIYRDSDLIAALNSLKDMVARVEDTTAYPDNADSLWRPLHIETSGPIRLPNAAEIRRIIQEADGSIALGFTPGLTIAELRHKCASVFDSENEASAVRRIYVHGTLRNLCVEYAGQHNDAAFAQQCRSLSMHFSVQLGHAVNELKLIIPPTAEAASALTIASGAAMELCQPSIAQTLGSKAASIVLALGYNRLSSMQSDSESTRQVKIFVFWMAYWLDTSFSVRLGRAPIIRPDDIGVPQLSDNSIVPDGWAVAFNYSTRISGLQCKVVEHLYTPLSVQQCLEERKKRASRLLLELDQAWHARGPGPTTIALWKDSDAVMHYSTVCLVQQATFSSTSRESPALESARTALKLHVSAWHEHRHLPDFIWAGHCHWTLLKGPITPFVVTFCHIIAHPLTANEDVQLLKDFVDTLANLRRFSDGMVRLHKLCDTFTKVAMLYVKAKARESDRETAGRDDHAAAATGVDSEFGAVATLEDIDEYLSSIGFAPPPFHAAGTQSPELGDSNEFDSTFLMDWYQGNNSLMGFLEQELNFDGVPEYQHFMPEYSS